MSMYTKCGNPLAAIQVWNQCSNMLNPDSQLYTTALATCSKVGTAEALAVGQKIHTHISGKELQDRQLFNSLLNMYTKCEAPERALLLWDKVATNMTLNIDIFTASTVLKACAAANNAKSIAIGNKLETTIRAQQQLANNIVVNNALIIFYCGCGLDTRALRHWKGFMGRKIVPDMVTLLSIVKVCSNILDEENNNSQEDCFCALEVVNEVHDMVKVQSSYKTVPVYNALISAYSKCEPSTALEIWKNFHTVDIIPDSITYFSVLTACAAQATVESLEIGEQIHNIVRKSSSLETDIRISNALVNMYTVNKKPILALAVWNALRERQRPTERVSYICALRACASTQSAIGYETGKRIHEVCNITP